MEGLPIRDAIHEVSARGVAWQSVARKMSTDGIKAENAITLIRLQEYKRLP